ncbi:MAG: cupin domain-containing protein [Pseudohongiellaceae bacterium]|nr:cupin domain-containing protein [Pseudohongiellaceae bacterium]
MSSIIKLLMGLVLFAQSAIAQEEAQTVVEVLAKETQSWNGATLPAYSAGQPEVTIQKFTIPGHSTLAWHSHPVINAGYMLSGRLTVRTRDGATLYLEPGDTIVETVDTWHRGLNEYDEPVEILVFYAGIVDVPLAIEQEH